MTEQEKKAQYEKMIAAMKAEAQTMKEAELKEDPAIKAAMKPSVKPEAEEKTPVMKK